MDDVDVIALHLGALHPIETFLTLLLAFGPFAALAVVIAVRRRADAREEAAVAPTEVGRDDQRER